MTATFPTSQALAVRSTGRASSRTTDRQEAARTALAGHLATHDPLAHVDLSRSRSAPGPASGPASVPTSG